MNPVAAATQCPFGLAYVAAATELRRSTNPARQTENIKFKPRSRSHKAIRRTRQRAVPQTSYERAITMTSLNASRLVAIAATLAASSLAIGAEPPAGAVGKAISASDTVHCYDVHSCKGHSDCKTTEHACKGQNACKGHGFKAMKADECLNAGGTIGDIG
ncbi:MAG: hypothetical protein ACK4KV_05775 [Rhodocyclaceae bacterium]